MAADHAIEISSDSDAADCETGSDIGLSREREASPSADGKRRATLQHHNGLPIFRWGTSDTGLR